jgi:hypothetical protein
MRRRASLSACIRLVYTVNLTNATDYLRKFPPRFCLSMHTITRHMLTSPTDGVSKVILWGYAENGVGMVVGCVATLRPLLQRVLELGSSGSTHPHTPAAGYAKRPVIKSRLSGRDEEWVALEDGQMVNMVHGQESIGSEEYILPVKGGGIQVTRSVEQRSSALKD